MRSFKEAINTLAIFHGLSDEERSEVVQTLQLCGIEEPSDPNFYAVVCCQRSLIESRHLLAKQINLVDALKTEHTQYLSYLQQLKRIASDLQAHSPPRTSQHLEENTTRQAFWNGVAVGITASVLAAIVFGVGLSLQENSSQQGVVNNAKSSRVFL